ncbi:MAG: NADH:flavin oxidoreductase/NADH oxidase [Pseudomonadota bacterium]
MPETRLFDPIKLRGVEIPNRITVAPMCQYTAQDGVPGNWHLVHLGQFAISGPGLVFTEATGVEEEGRITLGCTGLWNDTQEEAWRPVVEFFRAYGASKIGIQLAHAGRKASTDLPWKGGKPLSAEQGAWQTVGPSAEPYGDGWHTPAELGDNSLKRVREAFVSATERSIRLDFDVIELHSAHGYLLHQFLSPVSNTRTDQYGGSLENRMRFPLEVFDACRAIWPEEKPMGVRFSATDWVDGSSWGIEEAVTYTKALLDHGCDFVDVSSGGNSPAQAIKVGPGYQTIFAAEIKRQVPAMTVMAVGKITEAHQAEHILQTNQADMVALARGITYDSRWAWHAAEALGDQRAAFPAQYARSHPSMQGLPIPGNPPPAK